MLPASTFMPQVGTKNGGLLHTLSVSRTPILSDLKNFNRAPSIKGQLVQVFGVQTGITDREGGC